LSASGLFVTLEGGEGAGKSTAAAALAGLLRAEGLDVVVTREPGGTPGAEAIRGVLLNAEIPLSPLAQTLLINAARADHVAALIAPALARGAIVICDRYQDSTMAYQHGGLGLPVATIAALNALIGLAPDLTFMLEVPAAVARQRLAARGGGIDRYERLDEEFGRRIAASFRAIAAAEPARCLVLDGTDSPAAIAAAMRAALRERCGR
jgi:dTMP kinase